MPGESTGGNLVINTKTFPDERVRELSMQGGFTTGLTGETIFVDSLGGDFDVIGWDDGTRREDAALSFISEFLQSGEAIDTNRMRFALDDFTEGELRRAGALLMQDGFDLSSRPRHPMPSLGSILVICFYLMNLSLASTPP